MHTLALVIAVTATAGMAGTGLGGFAGALFGRNSEKLISLLLSFAAGVMLSVVCFDLITEALTKAGLTLVLTGVLAGFAAVYLLNDIVDRAAGLRIKSTRTAPAPKKPHRPDNVSGNCDTTGRRLFVGGFIMAAAIALHNLPEGMVIGASYAGSTETVNLSALAVAAVIGLHNIPEGMAVAVPLIAGGMSRAKAVIITVITGAPTVLGAVPGYLLGALSPLWTALALSLASGAMMYVVFGELLPDSALMWRSKPPVFAAIIGVITGILIINI